MKISKIILYDEPFIPEIKIKEIERFLVDTFSIRVETRGNFIDHFKNNIVEKIEKTKVFDTKKTISKAKRQIKYRHKQRKRSATI